VGKGAYLDIDTGEPTESMRIRHNCFTADLDEYSFFSL